MRLAVAHHTFASVKLIQPGASCSTLHDYQPRRLEESLIHTIAAGAFPSTLTDSPAMGTVSFFHSRRLHERCNQVKGRIYRSGPHGTGNGESHTRGGPRSRRL